MGFQVREATRERPMQTLIDICNNKGERAGEGWKPGLSFLVLREFMCSPAGEVRKAHLRGQGRLETLM